MRFQSILTIMFKWMSWKMQEYLTRLVNHVKGRNNILPNLYFRNTTRAIR